MVTPPATAPRRVLLASSTAPVECLRGVVRYAREQNWHLTADMMYTGALPRGWQGDGVLAYCDRASSLWTELAASALPCVSLHGSVPSAEIAWVDSHHTEVGRLAADHLLERSHRNYAWAPFTEDVADRARFAAFRARLFEHGCVCRELSPAYGPGAEGEGTWGARRERLVTELRSLPRPTAIVAQNDCCAASLVDACRDAGLCVPEDIAILAIGDSIVCTACPVPLSGVDLDLENVGYRGAQLLDRRMRGIGDVVTTVRVPPKGVITRVSTDASAVTDPRVSKAMKYIAENYPQAGLSVQAVAAAVGMSRRNLERSFRDETGCTLHAYIVSVRMREASRLLRRHPRAKNAEIAALVGVPGEHTFFRTFRRYFGESPKAHREWTPPGSASWKGRIDGGSAGLDPADEPRLGPDAA